MQCVLISEREADVGGSFSAPSAVDRQEKVGTLGDEFGLEFGRDHEVPVAVFDRGQRGKDVPADAEIVPDSSSIMIGLPDLCAAAKASAVRSVFTSRAFQIETIVTPPRESTSCQSSDRKVSSPRSFDLDQNQC